MAKKKLLIISTGGTIAQTRGKHGVSENVGKSQGQEFANLLENECSEANYEIDAQPIFDKDSSNIIPEDWELIIDAITQNYDKYDSFLITHGTNTLGYTSAALSFALGNLDKRVVLTGSQIPPYTSAGKPTSGSDALINLQNAARVAMHKRDLVGVMVVFGSKIITGTRVKKRTEFDYDGFESFSTVPLIGSVGNTIRFDKVGLDYHQSLYTNRAKTVGRLQVYKKFNMNIASLTEFPGMKPDIFVALANSNVRGIILRSVGAGDPNIALKGESYTNLRDGFDLLKNRGISIVVTTQAPRGVASMDKSDLGKAAYDMGAIPAWDMSIEAITVKLAWLLGKGVVYEDIRDEMLKPTKGEIVYQDDSLE